MAGEKTGTDTPIIATLRETYIGQLDRVLRSMNHCLTRLRS